MDQEYNFFLLEQNGKYLALVESQIGLVACCIPSPSKSNALHKLDKTKKLLGLEDIHYQEKIQNSKFAKYIFKLEQDPANHWRTTLSIPIDFQLYTKKEEKVARVLRKTTPGDIITYGEISKQVGIPHGGRFVGNCMAKNHLPLVIPCHRVLAANKKIGKFSGGGPEVKRKLLSNEGVIL